MGDRRSSRRRDHVDRDVGRPGEDLDADEALWAQAARTERTPNSVGKYAYYLLEAGHRAEAVRELEALSPQERTGAAATVYAKAIYSDPGRSAKDKAQVLLGETPRSPWAAYYLAALEAGRSQYSNAWQLMKGAFSGERLVWRGYGCHRRRGVLLPKCQGIRLRRRDPGRQEPSSRVGRTPLSGAPGLAGPWVEVTRE